MPRRSVSVDDDPHRDTASRADRRAIVIGLRIAVLDHTATLARTRFVNASPSDAERSRELAPLVQTQLLSLRG